MSTALDRVAVAYAAILADVLDVPSVSVDDHWFADLGADSMVMAKFCARVRQHADLPSVSMRDAYGTLTARSLAAVTASSTPTESATAEADRVPDNVRAAAEDRPEPGRAGTVEYFLCGAAQLAIFLAYVAAVSWLASLGYDWVTGASSLPGYYLRSVAAGAIAFVGISATPIAAKWILIGRWREDSIRIWSLRYLRFWTVRTLIRTNPLVLLAVGSPLYVYYLRALGATIGRGTVILTRNVPIATDLLSIGEGSIVRKDAVLLGYRARGGRIEIGSVSLGRNVLISEATVIDIGTSMGDDTQLGHQSSLHTGQHVPDGEHWAGSPSAPTDTDFGFTAPPLSVGWRRYRYTAAQLLSLLAVYLPLFVGGADVLLSQFPQAEQLTEVNLSPTSAGFYLEAVEISALWFFGVFFGGLAVVALVPRLLAPFVRPGRIYPLYGVHYTAARTIARLTSAKYYLYLFGDSSYILGYLRWIGYRLRHVAQTGSNFGTAVKHENPFATSVGSGTMVADGLSIMNAEYTNSSFRIAPVRLGSNSFLGNRIAFPPSGRTGDNCLLATKVMVPVDGPLRTGVGLLGSPSFEIPRTVERDHRFDHWTRGIELHRRLRLKNRHNRASMALAVLARWVYFFGVTVLTTVTALSIPRFGVLAFVGQALGFLLFTTLWFVLLERAGAGFRRLEPKYCSIYHPDFWRHERYWKFVIPDWDRTLGGTPFKNVVSRMLGVRLGRRVFDDGCSITERTLVTIGDDVTLGGHTVIQCHSQEDGTFKSGRIHLDHRSTLGLGAFVHYGTTLGADARLAPDSFLMKGEEVPPGAVWGGNPAIHLGDAVGPAALEEPSDEAARQFWTEVLGRGGVTAIPPWSRPDAPVGVASLSVSLPDSLADTSIEVDVPSRTLILAAHAAVLSVLTGQPGVTTAYRGHADGVPVPLTVDVEGEPGATWRELVGQVARREEQVREHADHPVDELVRLHGPTGPVTDVAFDAGPIGTSGAADLPSGCAVRVGVGDDGRSLHVHHRTETLDGDAAARLAGYHVRALELMAADLDADVRAETLLAPEEITLQLHGMGGPTRSRPSTPIHELVQDRAQRHPTAIAAVSGDRSWTYRRLDAATNRVAHALIQRGVRPGDVVAVATERTFGWLTSVLAVLAAGAVYLPIEPHFPADRIRTTLRRARCTTVVVEGAPSPTVLDAAERTDATSVDITDHLAPLSKNAEIRWAKRRPGVSVPLDSPAYIYFTSGSTGEPKGAMCAHAGMVNHVFAKIEDLSIGEGAVVAQTAPQCFDISLWQLVAGLVVGGRTVLVPQDVILDVERFVATVTDAKVEVLQVVPSYLDVVLAYLESTPRSLDHLQCVSVTGEAVKKDLTERFFEATSSIALVNAYGLTETSDDTNHEVMHSVPRRDRVPLGPPIGNVRIYLLDDDLAPVPLGAHGEIVFSGVCVGLGYVNDPERTARVFRTDPHRPGERLYRSGDLGRWLPEGKLEFLGRRDTQVKIRGFRIEIGEIDNALLGVPGIRDGAVVVAESPDGGEHLVAFYSAADALAEETLRSALSRSLPHYMVPTAYHWCETMPLTANSKIDRKALTARATDALSHRSSTPVENAVPKSPAECALAEVWADLLGVDAHRIAPSDSFFDHGGTSLSAVKLAIALGNSVTLDDIKRAQSLADLAELLSTDAATLTSQTTR